MQDLVDRAHSMGYTVEWVSMSAFAGLLMPNKRILINQNRLALAQRTALAHELGHAYHGHDWRDPHSRAKDERQADLYAAHLLIDPVEYAFAEMINHHPGAIGKELGVPRRLVELWQSTLMPA